MIKTHTKRKNKDFFIKNLLYKISYNILFLIYSLFLFIIYNMPANFIPIKNKKFNNKNILHNISKK